MFDGTVFLSIWDEIGLQTELGYKFLLVMEQIVAKHTKEDAKASKLKRDDFSEQAFERQGSLAHRVIKNAHGEPDPVLEAGAVDHALVGQPALERVLADWLPL
eukprot:8895829-Pyramimonas_sp.AAC.1